jgi:hypothetical protein
MRVATPHPPQFFTGPVSLLLTNSGGFGAHLEAQGLAVADSERSSKGQLLVRGSKLFYAPDQEETEGGPKQLGGYSFVWDVASNQGYVLSEALQAYAPLSSNLSVTNLSIQATKGATQKISGHQVEAAAVILEKSDGGALQFEVERAVDLRGVPVRVESVTNAMTLTLTLSKIHLETPPADAFAPPEGFTKYASPEAMADELAARQHNLRRKTYQPSELFNLPEKRY